MDSQPTNPNTTTTASSSGIAAKTPKSQAKPLSCTSCRARKLKCDRQHPCRTCVKSGSECVFPARKRIQRPRKTKNSELLQRLNRLESIVGKVGLANVEEQTSGPGPGFVQEATGASTPPVPSTMPVIQASSSGPVGEGRGQGGRGASQDATASRYLSGEFWSNLCGEVEGLKQALEHSTDSDDDEPLEETTPDSGTGKGDRTSVSMSPGLPGMLLGASSSPHARPERIEHPPPGHIRFLAATYFENVDMVLKILHRPTVTAALERLIDWYGSGETRPSPEWEALFFSIYYAAVTSLTPSACLGHLGQSRAELARTYQYAIEATLSKADYLNSTSLETLQALTIYVACLRSHNGSRSSWALLSLPIRLAQALNLHLDGDGARLPPFEAEQRRRLWWQLIVLDIRAVEDRGTTTVVPRQSYDTRLPHNVDDADFGPHTVGPLVDRPGPSDATFSLATAQCSDIFLYAEHAQNDVPASSSSPPVAGAGAGAGCRPQRSEQETIRHAQHLESQFVTNADPRHAGSYLASVTVRLIILKLWLAMQYPLHPRTSPSNSNSNSTIATTMTIPNRDSQHPLAPPPPPPTTHDNSRSTTTRTNGTSTSTSTLRTAVSIMELSEFAQSGPYSSRFRWWADMYVQWHPLAVALAELCAQHRIQTRTQTNNTKDGSGEVDIYDRAWAVVEDVYPKWSEIVADTKRGRLWRPIRRLYKKAKAARAAALGGGGDNSDDNGGDVMMTTTTTTKMENGEVGNWRGAVADQGGRGGEQARTGTAPEMALRVDDLTIDPATTQGTGVPGVDPGFREPNSTLDLNNLSTSPYAMTQMWMAWPDVSFDMPPPAAGMDTTMDTMDWSTWDEFVLDTYADEQKSGSSGGS